MRLSVNLNYLGHPSIVQYIFISASKKTCS